MEEKLESICIEVLSNTTLDALLGNFSSKKIMVHDKTLPPQKYQEFLFFQSFKK